MKTFKFYTILPADHDQNLLLKGEVLEVVWRKASVMVERPIKK